jgi:Ankyrin repeats (many copies)
MPLVLLDCDRDSDTPLIYASFNGDLASVKLLIENGADASVRNRVGATPVWNASYGGHVDVLRYLISVGNPDLSVASRGMDQHSGGPLAHLIYDVARTPLYVALARGHYRIAEILLDCGVDMRDERWFWNDETPDGLDCCWTERLRMIALNAPTLLNCVRRYTRRLLGNRALVVVPHLDIPATLKDYLLLKSR